MPNGKQVVGECSRGLLNGLCPWNGLPWFLDVSINIHGGRVKVANGQFGELCWVLLLKAHCANIPIAPCLANHLELSLNPFTSGFANMDVDYATNAIRMGSGFL